MMIYGKRMTYKVSEGHILAKSHNLSCLFILALNQIQGLKLIVVNIYCVEILTLFRADVSSMTCTVIMHRKENANKPFKRHHTVTLDNVSTSVPYNNKLLKNSQQTNTF